MMFQDLELGDALADLDDDTLPDGEFIRRQAERLNQCNETRIKEEENSGVKWVRLEEVKKVSNEKWMCENIYGKLNKRLQRKENLV